MRIELPEVSEAYEFDLSEQEYLTWNSYVGEIWCRGSSTFVGTQTPQSFFFFQLMSDSGFFDPLLHLGRLLPESC